MKFTILKLTTLIFACLFGASLIAVPTHATSICDDSNIPEEVRAASGCGGSTEDELPKTIENILYAVIAASGLVAVAFIVVGGINYITSNGEAAKVEKAKKTVLYACIGLIICALAFAIVNFTITNVIEHEESAIPSSTNIAYNINITTKE